jgi:hypothetical protein
MFLKNVSFGPPFEISIEFEKKILNKSLGTSPKIVLPTQIFKIFRVNSPLARGTLVNPAYKTVFHIFVIEYQCKTSKMKSKFFESRLLR